MNKIEIIIYVNKKNINYLKLILNLIELYNNKNLNLSIEYLISNNDNININKYVNNLKIIKGNINDIIINKGFSLNCNLNTLIEYWKNIFYNELILDTSETQVYKSLEKNKDNIFLLKKIYRNTIDDNIINDKLRLIFTELLNIKKYKIYLPWPFKNGRLKIAKHLYDGFLNNKRIELVDNFDDADYIIYTNDIKSIFKLKIGHYKRNKYIRRGYIIDKNFAKIIDNYKEHKKEIIVDYDDPTELYYSNTKEVIEKSFLVFKRSTVDKRKGHLKYCREIIHTSYFITQECIKNIDLDIKKEWDISCLLRGQYDRCGLRKEILNYLENNNLKLNYKIFSNYIGNIRNKNIYYTYLNLDYFKQLKKSKIVITCDALNNYYGEGDARLWEALCSGSLVFSGKILTPIKYPLIHKKHLIYFNNIKELDTLLRYYLINEKEGKQIAKNGYEYAIKYHTYISRTNEIIDEIILYE